MLPLENYYNRFIKNDIIGKERAYVIDKLSHLLACHVITKNKVEVVHIRYFPCNEKYEPQMDKWIGTIAIKFDQYGKYVIQR